MKVERITFMQTFPTGSFANQKLGMDIIIESEVEEEITEAYKRARQFCEKAFEAMNPQINWEEPKTIYPIQETIQPKDERIQSFIDLVNSKYQTKKTLENLRSQIEEKNNPELTEAFNNKLKTFE